MKGLKKSLNVADVCSGTGIYISIFFDEKEGNGSIHSVMPCELISFCNITRALTSHIGLEYILCHAVGIYPSTTKANSCIQCGFNYGVFPWLTPPDLGDWMLRDTDSFTQTIDISWNRISKLLCPVYCLGIGYRKPHPVLDKWLRNIWSNAILLS